MILYVAPTSDFYPYFATSSIFEEDRKSHAFRRMFAMCYNFVRIHKTLRTTPAMTALGNQRCRRSAGSLGTIAR
jgi:hypothetical protein